MHPKHHKKEKFKNELCDNNMTFQECELAILRHAVDQSEKEREKEVATSEDILKIISILEKFLQKKKLVCYGGTAINNILPKHAQFYNRDEEIPDYDFFSDNALHDAKELADIYYAAGYVDIEAKAGVHMGTFKVYVNFIAIADITLLDKRIFSHIYEESIVIDGIHYAPPNYLRMAMYLELSRPMGDVSRWEKVMKRLNLLNEYYPFQGEHCQTVDFQRELDSNVEESERLYVTTRDALIRENVIFFGGYATSLYSRYMPENERRLVKKVPDFDVLSTDYETCAMSIKKHLENNQFKKVKLVYHDAIGEIVPEHIEIRVEKETIAFVYTPIGCHSYNTIQINDQSIHVATIDTILTFYLSFVYAGMPYYNKDRLLCMAKFLFDVEQKNRLAQKGLLHRFTIECYGKQLSLPEIRAEKALKYKELKDKVNTEEYDMWFLNYNPEKHKKEKQVQENMSQTKTPKTMKSHVPVEKFIRKKNKTKKKAKPNSKSTNFMV